ncbi:PAS domain S-box protein [Methylomonas sp. AM2-LC]|uniref:PAS domain-containing sensor histidine kinase n=1 Tax=Methylomonas sp. AM2-LC TaxID=3153301 RepID=UPI003266899D
MKKPLEHTLSLEAIRQHAEQQLPTEPLLDMERIMNEKQLLHELQVHQIELEMQVEALQEAHALIEQNRLDLEDAKQCYIELFDFAPIPYVILREDGLIQNSNLSAASVLGVSRSKLVGQNFMQFVLNEDRHNIIKLLETVFVTKNKQKCDITLQIDDANYDVAIEAIIHQTRPDKCLVAMLDISERKQNERYLIERNEFFTSILNSLNSQIAIVDTNGIIMAVNDAWIKFGSENGLLASGQSLLGYNYLEACKNNNNEFLCEEAYSAFMGLSAVLSGKQTLFTLEYHCHSPEQDRWFRMVVTPLKFLSYSAVISHEDITQRKQAERIPNLLKAMLEVSLDGFLELDLEGNILQANEACAKITGYAVEELISMRISQLDINQDQERISANLVRVKQQCCERSECRYRHKDGHVIDMEISIAFLSEFQRYCAFYRDLTQRKKTEAQLSAIFSASVEGIITYDVYSNIISANPAIETIFGYEPEELLGCNINMLMPFLPKCQNQHCSIPHFKDTNQVARSVDLKEIEGKHKNGSTLYLEVSGIDYINNNVCYFVSVVRDISVRKQRERKDKAHIDELAHITRLGLMGEMASGIAHEVNQPLTAIASYAQASLNLIENAPVNLPSLTEILNKIQQQALRAGQIIHRMRDFVQAGPRHISTVDINQLINETVVICAAEIKQNNINLECHFSEHLLSVFVDRIQIQQVLINLILNALDAMQGNTGYAQRKLTIQTYMTTDNQLQVRVKDTGLGMSEEQQLKIFKPFYTSKAVGMGMGLAISRTLIEAHQGVLRFNSKVGKGSTFYFTLPCKQNAGSGIVVAH